MCKPENFCSARAFEKIQQTDDGKIGVTPNSLTACKMVGKINRGSFNSTETIFSNVLIRQNNEFKQSYKIFLVSPVSVQIKKASK